MAQFFEALPSVEGEAEQPRLGVSLLTLLLDEALVLQMVDNIRHPVLARRVIRRAKKTFEMLRVTSNPITSNPIGGPKKLYKNISLFLWARKVVIFPN